MNSLLFSNWNWIYSPFASTYAEPDVEGNTHDFAVNFFVYESIEIYSSFFYSFEWLNWIVNSLCIIQFLQFNENIIVIAKKCFSGWSRFIFWHDICHDTWNSAHDWKVVSSNLVSSNILDGNGVKNMLGSIPAPNSGLLYKNKKNTGSQMGHTKKLLTTS